ncbi:MAG TPA: hypothetical protein VJX67_07160 [Blastocatellia bacterium]|nr:hypothetical protein [Blastocatellia bacterium]
MTIAYGLSDVAILTAITLFVGRTHIVIHEQLAQELDALVGKRGCDSLLIEAAWKEARRRRVPNALEQATGSWKELKANAQKYVEPAHLFTLTLWTEGPPGKYQTGHHFRKTSKKWPVSHRNRWPVCSGISWRFAPECTVCSTIMGEFPRATV